MSTDRKYEKSVLFSRYGLTAVVCGLLLAGPAAMAQRGTARGDKVSIPIVVSEPQISAQMIEGTIPAIITQLSVTLPEKCTWRKPAEPEREVKPETAGGKAGRGKAVQQKKKEAGEERFITQNEVDMKCLQLQKIATHPDLEEASGYRKRYYEVLYNASIKLRRPAAEMTRAVMLRDQKKYDQAAEAYEYYLEELQKAYKTKKELIPRKELKKIKEDNYQRRVNRFMREYQSGKVDAEGRPRTAQASVQGQPSRRNVK